MSKTEVDVRPPTGSSSAGPIGGLECAAWDSGERTSGAASPQRGKLSNLPVLDGVRGLAVLLVLAFHFLLNSPDISLAARSADWLRKFSFVGWTGVDLFFVLSGFLITRILLNARPNPGYFRNFYARRMLRIFPLFYATLAFVLLVLPAVSDACARYAAQIGGAQVYLWTYTYNIATLFAHGNVQVLDFGHFWSLCVEEHFYLFWPLLVWFLGVRGVRCGCVVLIAAAIACRIAMHFAGVHSTAIFYFTPCRVDSLAMGAWVATYAVDAMGRQQTLPATWLRRAMVIGAVALVVEGVVVALDHGAMRGGVWSQCIGFSVIAVIWTCLLIVALCSRAEGLLSRGLSGRVMRSLGKYSYGLYVLHPLIGLILGGWVTAGRHRPFGARGPGGEHPGCAVHVCGIGSRFVCRGIRRLPALGTPVPEPQTLF